MEGASSTPDGSNVASTLKFWKSSCERESIQSDGGLLMVAIELFVFIVSVAALRSTSYSAGTDGT